MPSRIADTRRASAHEVAFGQRRIALWNDTSAIDTTRWKGARTIIRLERSGVRNGKDYAHVHYFLTSLQAAPEVLANIIRQHWEVENNAHRVKDVALHEDHTPSKDQTANAALALMRNMLINVYRSHGFDSITEAIQRFTNLVKELYDLISRT
jgi:predicted transposase YbfD/YdcC